MGCKSIKCLFVTQAKHVTVTLVKHHVSCWQRAPRHARRDPEEPLHLRALRLVFKHLTFPSRHPVLIHTGEFGVDSVGQMPWDEATGATCWWKRGEGSHVGPCLPLPVVWQSQYSNAAKWLRRALPAAARSLGGWAAKKRHIGYV